MPTKVYTGSTISKEGGFRRIAIHEKEIHNTTATAANAKHYTFCRKDSVASNFRVVGLWRNPALLDGKTSNQDVKRWLPVFFEGLLIFYFGTCHKTNRIYGDRAFLCSNGSYRLVREVQEGLSLPVFHAHLLDQKKEMA
ncbi:hypothetical protein H9L39_01045 [Fusarium oxysporum f. sp. albedinis]|nr:hypothetical protein H9L39_01045 [Fusarium oxysporum f. sp. albedinis]